MVLIDNIQYYFERTDNIEQYYLKENSMKLELLF
jgi:hypothetical protein